MQNIRRGTISIDTFAALCGMVWFVLIIDACFTWFWSVRTRLTFASLFVFAGTLALSQNGRFFLSKRRLALILPLFVLTVYMILVKHILFNSLIKYVPLVCIVCWHNKIHQKIYEYFRKFVIFYAIVSIAVEVLVVSGLWLSLPHTILPPQDYVQQQLGVVNYFYGFFCIPTSGDFLTFYRACGPLREGGHFSFFLGFVYWTELTIHNKRNPWVIICGFLTISPNFPIFLLVTEGYMAIKNKQVIRPLITLVSIIAVVYVSYRHIPETIQKEITRIVLERTLEESIENTASEGYMALIDGRASSSSIQSFANFLKSDLPTVLFGLDTMESGLILSDYRYLIMLYGYIGAFLFLWCTYAFSCKIERSMYGFFILLFAIIILIQRAWMFNQVYIWTMMFLTIMEKKRLDEKDMIWKNH